MHPLALLCLLVMLIPITQSTDPPPRRGEADARLTAVLRSVAQAQSAYRASHGRYTASLSALGVERPPGTQVRLQAEGSAGFSAVATSSAAECAVYHGGVRAPRPWARTEGRIACRRR